MSFVRLTLAVLTTALIAATARADDSFAPLAEQVNSKLVKLFGAGGVRGLASYGTGVVVSPDGYVLTVQSHILETQDVLVHTADGVRYHARDMVVVVRGHIANIPIVLSSATPSIESEVHARRGRYARLSPPERSRRGASRPRGLRPKSKRTRPHGLYPSTHGRSCCPGGAPNM